MPARSVILICCLALPVVADDKPASKLGTTIPVELAPGEPGSPGGPRYSPKGTQLQLVVAEKNGLPGFDHRVAHMKLGPNAKSSGHRLVIARSEKGKPYDRLWVDRDGDGKLADKPIEVQPKELRKNLWSSFDATVRVNHAGPGDKPAFEDYPIALWVVVEKEADVPDVIRFSRRGFLAGPVKVGDASFTVVLSDSNNDAVFGPGDWWEINSKDKAGEMRTVGDYAWAGGKAWKLELVGTNGRKAKLVSFDPGVTEAEDAIKRDKLREDRLAKRADKPVAFRHDVDAALKEAAEKKQSLFLKFETDWCIPCKQMTQLVFTAKDVADAAAGVTCVVIDGDARKDLTERYQVKGYPTGILLNASGKEVTRYVGYQSVKETAAFFGKVKK
jgi:thiol-disulfide isomerase/thioredoxin